MNSSETKRQVFEVALDDWRQNFVNSLPRDGSFEDWSESLSDYSARYAAALPDDLPTIPEVVDEFIRGWGYATLVMIFSQAKHLSAFAPTEREQHGWQWIVDNEDEFARAWVYGVWIVQKVDDSGHVHKEIRAANGSWARLEGPK